MFSKTIRVSAGFVFGILVLFSLGYSTQVIDCIAAEVNNRVITLTDLRILKAFNIYEKDLGKNSVTPLLELLEKAVDQKTVIELAREKITVTRDEVEALFQDVMKRLEPGEGQAKLHQFGLKEDELKAYLEEKLLYEKILGLRFNQSINVSLREIEAYYHDVYSPSQKAQGKEPEPMIQLLDEIELQIKQAKTAAQVASWIKNLRSQAEIRIKPDCLNQIE